MITPTMSPSANRRQQTFCCDDYDAHLTQCPARSDRQAVEYGVPGALHAFSPVTARQVRVTVTEVFAYGAGAGPIPDEIEVLGAGTGRNLARGTAVATGRSTLRCDYSPSHLTDRPIGDEYAWKASAPGPAATTGSEGRPRSTRWAGPLPPKGRWLMARPPRW